MSDNSTLPSKFYLHASNVHQGGGRSLLEPLLNLIHDKVQVVVSLDVRMPFPEASQFIGELYRVKPSILQRFKAEKWLAQSAAPEDTILCFGNLPPLFKLRGHTVVFVQNRYLIDEIRLDGFPFRIRLRLMLERLWWSAKIFNADEFIVQTPTMKRLLEIKTQNRVPVRVLPFVAEPKGYMRAALQSAGQMNKEFDFVYVASGEPHKNHSRLIEAWCLLAEQGCFPSLCLTLDEKRFSGLTNEIEAKKRSHGIKLQNMGGLAHRDVLTLYGRSSATIYPSTFESFGLPLIEARQAGLPVLASEMDYVRDVIDPEQTFDPTSAISIARAVKRFLGESEQPLPVLDASQFLDAVMRMN